MAGNVFKLVWRLSNFNRIALGLLFCCWSGGPQADDSVSIKRPACEARIERPSNEPSILVVRSSGCRLTLDELADVLDAGLRHWFAAGELPIRSISLGRVMDYPQWSQDLAKAAAQSRDWDGKRGRPRNPKENDNHRVRLLLNGAAFPEPLNRVFERYGYRVCIGDVEKVLVFKAKDVLSAPTVGISPHAKLPVDGQVWLHLQSDPSCK